MYFFIIYLRYIKYKSELYSSLIYISYVTSNHKKKLCIECNEMSNIQVLIYKLLSLIRYLFASNAGEKKNLSTILFCLTSIVLVQYLFHLTHPNYGVSI